jgi:sterol desaturase/sphingolipid hydroxylase (fatty acid hydroxylase superfamily)
MHLKAIAIAVPFFSLMIAVEYYVCKKKGLPYFNLQRSVANISVGVAERLTDVLTAGGFYFAYDYLYRHYATLHISPGVIGWIALFLLTDFIWYWYHRFGHEVNLLWMAHIVHHQSEDFNYTVSARITIFQAVARAAFWSVLPILGFPPAMITTLLLIHGLYPFFVHSRLPGKLGPLEYLFVTPSHHRVHHASNAVYLDKNYGDVLIIWDKLFNTFQEELDHEPPVYGLTQPLRSYSFLWQHFHFFIELAVAFRNRKTFSERIKLLFAKPEKLEAGTRERAAALFQMQSGLGETTQRLNRYVLSQIFALLVGLTAFIYFEPMMHWQIKTLLSTIIIVTLVNCGAIMEQKRWVFYLEFSRFMLLLLVPFCFPDFWPTKLFILLAGFLATLAWFKPLEQKYFRYVCAYA